MARGRPKRAGYEYERNGNANIFMPFAPLEGWRQVEVTDRHFPATNTSVLMQDNLSTHTAAALYATFAPTEAHRPTERFGWHYTPKRGGWLNIAESELGVLSSQCLDRCREDKDRLMREAGAWPPHRNKHHATANWQFTNENARVKLRPLFQSL